jgi:hypothetical protein
MSKRTNLCKYRNWWTLRFIVINNPKINITHLQSYKHSGLIRLNTCSSHITLYFLVRAGSHYRNQEVDHNYSNA